MTGESLSSFPESAIRRELEAISRSPTLARSPVMLRLLRYLVDQSLSNNGTTLKSYAVAVDGLGRDSDFDAQSDSYPRVQVGRLRRLLELHYHRLGDDDRAVRLRIASIGYAVVVADSPPHIALPLASDAEAGGALLQSVPADKATDGALSPHGVVAQPASVVGTVPPTDPVTALPGERSTLSRRRWPYWSAALLVTLIIVVAGALMYRQSTVTQADSMRPPTLRVSVRGAVEQSEQEELRRWLMDSLQPSWVFSLVDDAAPRIIQRNGGQAAASYRLDVNIVRTATNRSMQLLLTDVPTGEIAWSDIVNVGPAGGPLTALEPSMAKLSGPAGVIATLQLRRFGDARLGNYGCALLTEQYLRMFDAGVRARLADCVARGLRSKPDDVNLLLARALMQFNRADRSSDLSAASLRRSYADVQRAAQIAPSNSAVALIQSRYLFLRGDCVRGTVRAQQAIEAWPLVPRNWGLTGFFLFDCNDPRATEYVSRAAYLQGGTTSLYESVRIFEALERRDLATANRIANQMNPEDRASDLYQQLTDAVLAAANGPSRRAWPVWASFAANVGMAPDDADAVLRHYAVGARYRRIALQSLEPMITEHQAGGT